MPSRPRSPAMEEEEEIDDWENRSFGDTDNPRSTVHSGRRPRSTTREEDEELDWEDRPWTDLDEGGAEKPLRDSRTHRRLAYPKARKTVLQAKSDDWENRSWTDLGEGCWAKDRQPPPEVVEWSDDGDAETTDNIFALEPCHGGRFIRLTILRSRSRVFEITAKYGPPVGFIAGGAYGTVCYAFRSDKDKLVAIKKIANAFVDATQAKMVLREVMLHRLMNHPNIVSLMDIIPPPQRELFKDVYITFEHIHTDMGRVINLNQALPNELCESYLYQLLCGLKYLHSANIIHRDLKPSNLLLTKDGVLKICDFGLARSISQHDPKMTIRVGTLSYKAPEILLHSSVYTSAVDVWSVGCIFTDFMLGKTLLKGDDEEHQLSLIFKLVGTPDEAADLGFLDRTARSDVLRHPHCPRQPFTNILPDAHPLAIDLVEKMLTFDPRQRITIEDAITHPYLAKLRDPSNELVSVPFRSDFEEQALSLEEMKDLIYEAALDFNPDFRD